MGTGTPLRRERKFDSPDTPFQNTPDSMADNQGLPLAEAAPVVSFAKGHAMIRTLILTALVTGCLFITGPVSAEVGRHPEPNPYPLSWELKFQSELPRRIAVEVPGERLPKAYWYITYKVVNLTDRERMFLPVFEMLTDDGRVLRSDRSIPPTVFEAIKARVGNPLLQSATKVAGPLLVGEDQVKYGVAIWEEPAPRVPGFTVFVAGLSGETATPTGPDGKPILDKDGQPVVLRKSLVLKYTTRGDEFYAGEDKIERTTRVWVMR